MLHVILNEWLYTFIAGIINIHGSGVLVALFGCCMAAISAQVPCTPLNHVPVYSVTLFKARVYVSLAVTCHLCFWQNDWDLLHATVLTWGWNGYWNKSTESWPWRRKLSRRSCRDSNPGTFKHESNALTTEPSPLPSWHHFVNPLQEIYFAPS